MQASRWLLWAGLVLILAGCVLASAVQTAGGIKIRDVRFVGSNGTPMSGLLYVPPNATAKTRAPGILAVHGYFNSRETQDGFAIEFARRGYVVLALDQTGHGYSGATAFQNGFGGPDGLRCLRSLDIVDTSNIGLEGHSMGGWAVVTAAAAIPDGYKSIVIEGSSTGRPFAPEGTPTFPRNLAVVFSQFDEFAQTMWGAPSALEVPQAPRLMAVFGTRSPVQPDRLYGDINAGTGRIFHAPAITHAQDHFSGAAIGHSVDWFQRTLTGGRPLPSSNQIWFWKELGTLIALVGFVALILGAFDLLLRAPFFAPLAAAPAVERSRRDLRWWLALALTAAIPALTYLPLFHLAERLLPASPLLPQSFTNQIALWAVVNALIGIGLAIAFRRGGTGFAAANLVRNLLLALAVVAIGYGALAVADGLFEVDFRFWVVALKLLDRDRFVDALSYLLPFTLFFLLTLRTLHQNLALAGHPGWTAYIGNAVALAGGFVVFLVAEYAVLFTTGRLLTPNEGLLTIMSMQFVALMAVAALISTFTYRRTNSYVPGALICSLLVTWYIVAGQATHAA